MTIVPPPVTGEATVFRATRGLEKKVGISASSESTPPTSVYRTPSKRVDRTGVDSTVVHMVESG